jgi:hypothetical protein
VCLNVAAAFSFSEWATTIVASTSRTTRSFSRVRPATRAAGGPPARSHTRALVRARAFSTRRSLAGVSSSRARHTVGGEATDPSTASWWRRVSMSAIASAPPASMVATSTKTCPRSCPGTNPRRDRALESSLSGRPGPPADAPRHRRRGRPRRHHHPRPTGPQPTLYSSRTKCLPVPGLCDVAITSIPLQDRHFGTSRERVTPRTHEGPRLATMPERRTTVRSSSGSTQSSAARASRSSARLRLSQGSLRFSHRVADGGWVRWV